MIDVTREEAMAIRAKFPDACVVRTKHKWHTAEVPKVMTFIRVMRGEVLPKKKRKKPARRKAY